jgi:hypothetical protein
MGPPLQLSVLYLLESFPLTGGPRCTTQESNHTRFHIKVNFMGNYAA